MADQRYTITERVDQGGMAEVFRGVAEGIKGFKKSVAIKRILPNLTKNKKMLLQFILQNKNSKKKPKEMQMMMLKWKRRMKKRRRRKKKKIHFLNLMMRKMTK